MSFRKKAIGYGVGPLGSALFSLISVPVIAWFYSIEDVARFALFQTIVVLYTLVFSFGLDQAYIREYYDTNDKDKLLGQILKGIILPSFTFILLCSLLFKEQISYLLYDKYTLQIFFLTIFSSLFSLLIRVISSIQRVRDQAILFSCSQFLPKLMFLLVLLIMTYTNKPTFENILWSQFIATFVVLIFFVKINKKYLLSSLATNVDSSLKGYYIFGFPLILTGGAIWGLKLADRFYLKIFSTLEQLGVYSMAITIASGVIIFSSIFNTIWSPLVYKWASSGNIRDENIVKKVGEIGLKGSLAIIAIVVLLIPFSYIATIFLPEQYKSVSSIIPLCALAPLFYTLSEITGIGINLTKQTKYTLFSCFIAIIFHIFLSIYLIPMYGALGASIAGVLAFYIFFLSRSIFSNLIWVKVNYTNIYILNIVSLIIASSPVFIL